MFPKALLLAVCLFTILLCTNCANNIHMDHLACDAKIAEDAAVWTMPGEQSILTPDIYKEAANIQGGNRREQVIDTVAYVWNNYAYDLYCNSDMFSRTADELCKSGVLGGCADYSLIIAALLRARGVPARILITVNVKWMLWMQAHQQDVMSIPFGHSFIEVYLEDGWWLLDPVKKILYGQYIPQSASLPEWQYLLAGGLDFWSMGLSDIQSARKMFIEFGLAFNKDTYNKPDYPSFPIEGK